MFKASPAFARYRDAARQGRIALWRLLLGLVLILAIYALTAVVAIVVTAAVDGSLGRMARGEKIDYSGLLLSPTGLVGSFAAFAGVWLGVWLAMRLLHRQSLRSLLGAARRLVVSNFMRGFAATLISSALFALVSLPIDPTVERGSIALDAWLLWLVPLLAVLLIQTSAEELLFRGYLMRTLAARFRSPLIWRLLPVLLFTAAHGNADASWEMNVALLVSTAAFAATAALLVYATGNLGAAMGVHFANNLVAVALYSSERWSGGIALFRGQPVESPDWSLPQIVALALVSIASLGLTLWLLLHEGSPLRVARTDAHEPSPS